jgi:hypothetical protein
MATEKLPASEGATNEQPNLAAAWMGVLEDAGAGFACAIEQTSSLSPAHYMGCCSHNEHIL